MSYFLMVDVGVHYWFAMAGSAVIVAVLAIICERLVFHPLRHSPPIHDKIAATLYAPINLVYPAMGHLVIMKAFVIIILGGMGSIPGAIVGGMIIGFAEAFGGFYISTAYKDIIAFGLLVVILSIRPQGLFAKGAH